MRLAVTLLLLFAGPVVLYQAFKNQDHPWYLPVLVVGGLLALGAILNLAAFFGFLKIRRDERAR